MGDAAAELYVAVVRLVRGLRREAPNETVAAGGLSVLATLSGQGPMRATALADSEGVSGASMTRIVTRLSELGLVERAADPDDGRAQLVTLTDAGRRLIEQGTAARIDAVRRRLDTLSAADRRTLADAVELLRRLGEA